MAQGAAEGAQGEHWARIESHGDADHELPGMGAAVGKPFGGARARLHVRTEPALWPTTVCQRGGGMLCFLR